MLGHAPTVAKIVFKSCWDTCLFRSPVDICQLLQAFIYPTPFPLSIQCCLSDNTSK